MIVSNFTPSTSGALQGVDLLARAPKAEPKGEVTSSFSDLLGATNRPDALVGDAREIRQQSRGSQPVAGGIKKSVASTSGDASNPVDPQTSGASKPDAPVASPGLDDAPQLVRDPRLDDPAELALEAAAIAIASGLLAKPQELVSQPATADESQTGLSADQGGKQPQAQAGDQSAQIAATSLGAVAASALPPVSALAQPVENAAGRAALASSVQVQVDSAPLGQSDVSPVFEAQASALGATAPDGAAARVTSAAVSNLSFTATAKQTPVGAAQSPVGKVSSTSVVPAIVPKVVLTATVSQAVAIAGAGESLISPALSTPGTVTQQAPLVLGGKSSVAPANVPAALEPALPRFAEVSVVAETPAAPSGNAVQPGIGDAALLFSSEPESLAKAFFAGQAQQPKLQAAPTAVPDQKDVKSQAVELPAVAVVAVQDAKAGNDASAQASRQPQEEEPLSRALNETLLQAKGANTQVKQQASGQSTLPVQSESEVGTLGAKDGSVQRETSTVLASSDESTTAATAKVETASSASSTLVDPSSTASTQGGPSVRSSHESSSKPTVLPPVHTKSSELFNVVQNALERARSENPSHLAVEVTLEDGSSFGLEVRMSASGLQASFRSDSQPLLKALESSWGGFLAKESADSKVTSAAFEGRSGFGEFSNNGASTGERRQQFEDSASAALLSDPSGTKPAPGKPQGGTPKGTAGQPAASSQGMALYA